MEVLGIDPIQRLVVPRVLASMVVAVLLNGLVSAWSAWPAATSSTWSCRAARPARTWRPSRRWPACPTSGPARSRRWSSARRRDRRRLQGPDRQGRPKGVGDAVNQSVVITFMLLFAAELRDHRRLLPGRPPPGL